MKQIIKENGFVQIGVSNVEKKGNTLEFIIDITSPQPQRFVRVFCISKDNDFTVKKTELVKLYPTQKQEDVSLEEVKTFILSKKPNILDSIKQ